VVWALVRNVGTCVPMQREKSKWRTHQDESTEAGRRDGATRSSNEVCQKRMERRGCVIQLWSRVNRINGRSL
jgi:hypothetical protein